MPTDNSFLFRRIRELNENNTKRYIDERKRQALQQSRQIDSLKKVHGEQIEKLEQEMKRVMFLNEVLWWDEMWFDS